MATQKSSTWGWLTHAFVWAGGVVMVVPFYFMFVFATRTRTDIFSVPPPMWFGSNFLANFQLLLERVPFGSNVWVSVQTSVLGTIFTLFFCSLGGYAFAMYDFRGKNRLFALVMATMMIPPFLGMLPSFILMDKIGWLNKTYALWIPGVANAFGIFMMRQFIGSAIPRELVEAARVDGCSEFRIYWNVVLPLIGPGLGTLGLIAFVGQWNNFLGALIIMNEPINYNIPLALRSLMGMSNTEWGALMAGAAISVFPMMVMFSIASRRMIEGLTQGALKG